MAGEYPVPGNIYDIVMGHEPDAASQASALANMIRGGRQSQILYSLGAHDVPGALSKAYGAQAMQDENLLEKAAVARAHYGEEARKAVLANALEKQKAHEAFVAGENEKNRTNSLLKQALANQGKPGNAVNPDDVKVVADAIINGTQPPDYKHTYKNGFPLRAELSRRGFDFATANQEWQAVGRNIATMNGPQQTRMRQSISSAYDQLGNIENLYGEWKKLAPVSGFKAFNRATLGAAKQTGGEVGAVAHALEASINDLIEAVGNVYMGGNTPTDKAFQLAASNLKADWDEPSFNKAVGLIRTNLTYRDNAIKHTTPIVPGGGSNRYSGEAATPAADEKRVQMKSPSGKIGPVKESNVEAAKKQGYTVVE